jgi:8-oxo-dGTP pyrophosphatase MutT (NUDIX family)
VVIIREIGNWGESQVTATEVPATRAIVPDVERSIEQAWNAASARLGAKLFNGSMCRFERLEASPDALRLWVSPTSYKPFLGTNLTNADVPPAARANPVGLSAALVTSDGWVMLGRRNASVAYYPNRIHPFAGSLEPGELSNIFDGVRRELREELKLEVADVAQLRCIGVIEDASLAQPELIFMAQSTRRRTEIEALLDDAEHHACVAVEAEPDRVEALMRDALLTPVAVGTLLLWGRVTFGDAWFESKQPQFAQGRPFSPAS